MGLVFKAKQQSKALDWSENPIERVVWGPSSVPLMNLLAPIL